MASNEPQCWKEVFTQESNSPKHLLWTATPLIDNEGICFACLVDAADITNLVAEHASLEAEFKKLEMFSHSAAHTLKTDWQGVSLLVDELSALIEESKEGGELPMEDIEALLGELGPRAAKGVQTVRDLLVFATAKGNPDFERLSLREVVQDVVRRVKSTTIAIADDVPDEIFRLDEDTFPVALLQIIENSVKYGQGNPVEISYTNRKLRVQDHGRGIPAESLDEIFGMFKRVATDVAGTGLGLAIAKQIIEVHGYRVWAESDGQGKGSAFIIDFGRKD
jgi:signal transduction histidine kinase